MATKVATPNMKKVKHQKNIKEKDSVSIPKFGFKSAFIIVLVAALSAFFLPNAVAMMGVNTKLITLISNSIFISLAVAYCQCFIEAHDGFGKRFIRLFICFFITIAIISYFWIYVGLYM